MTNTDNMDPELMAMNGIMKAMTLLGDDSAAQKRVLSWASEKLGLEISAPKPAERSQDSTAKQTESNRREGTFNTVAHALSANSARKLMEAAAIYLTLYQGKETFTREELYACSREARYWKADYASHTSVNVKRMEEAGFLFEKAKNVYSVSPGSLTEMEVRLAK